PVPAKSAVCLLCRPQVPLRCCSGWRDAAVSDQQTVARKPAERVQKLPGWPRDPYKGLDYFSATDAPLFGQRETEINDMVALLCSFDTRAVLLHGGTGTGKSSFLRAGLCQRLRNLPAEEGR